jgi:hypothetical protein
MAVTTIPSAGLTLGAQVNFRNLIINGDMSIAQRGTSASGITSSGYQTVDRLTLDLNSAGTWTVSQDTDVPTGQGFSKSFKLACTTANASLSASNRIAFRQFFEGQMFQLLKKGTSNAESVTLSFWVKSNKTGTYVIELYDHDNSRHINKSYTINSADTWEKKTLTFAGDTTGSLDNDNALSFHLEFWLGAGSTYTSGSLQTSWGSNTTANRAVGVVNLADSTSNYINFTGVQLEVGTSASDFEFLPYDVNLQRCLRYCQKWVPNSGSVAMRLGNGAIMDTQNMYFVAFPSVEMRTKPSLTLNSTTDWRIFHRGTTATTTNLTFETHGTNQVFNFLATVSSGLTSGDCGQLIGNSTNNYALFDAEL